MPYSLAHGNGILTTAAGLLFIGQPDGALLALEVAGGIAASFAQPARQTLMPGIVPRADLPAAVACNSLTFNVARFIGPALAGPITCTANSDVGGAGRLGSAREASGLVW